MAPTDAAVMLFQLLRGGCECISLSTSDRLRASMIDNARGHPEHMRLSHLTICTHSSSRSVLQHAPANSAFAAQGPHALPGHAGRKAASGRVASCAGVSKTDRVAAPECRALTVAASTS
jgi:hypothetical protein